MAVSSFIFIFIENSDAQSIAQPLNCPPNLPNLPFLHPEHWIVNGTKKWITNGNFADFFTVGCRTDGGFTVLLVERGPGVETMSIKTSYSPTAGTAYITFDNVKVPVENTLGPENAGLLVVRILS